MSRPKDQITVKIEEAVLAHLGENGSFSAEEIYDAVIWSNRKFRSLLNRINKSFPEFDVANGYEQYLKRRVREWIRRVDPNGDRIFVGIPVTGDDARGGVRYVMRMDATPEQLRKAGLAVMAGALAAMTRAAEHGIGANTLEVLDADNFSSLNGDYQAVNSRIKEEARTITQGIETATTRLGISTSDS